MVVNIEKVEHDFSSLMILVQAGETILIEQDGKPIGQLSPVSEGKRAFGSLEGRGRVPDDIKTPFENEINEMFYGE